MYFSDQETSPEIVYHTVCGLCLSFVGHFHLQHIHLPPGQLAAKGGVRRAKGPPVVCVMCAVIETAGKKNDRFPL